MGGPTVANRRPHAAQDAILRNPLAPIADAKSERASVSAPPTVSTWLAITSRESSRIPGSGQASRGDRSRRRGTRWSGGGYFGQSCDVRSLPASAESAMPTRLRHNRVGRKTTSTASAARTSTWWNPREGMVDPTKQPPKDQGPCGHRRGFRIRRGSRGTSATRRHRVPRIKEVQCDLSRYPDCQIPSARLEKDRAIP